MKEEPHDGFCVQICSGMGTTSNESLKTLDFKLSLMSLPQVSQEIELVVICSGYLHARKIPGCSAKPAVKTLYECL